MKVTAALVAFCPDGAELLTDDATVLVAVVEVRIVSVLTLFRRFLSSCCSLAVQDSNARHLHFYTCIHWQVDQIILFVNSHSLSV